MVNFSLRTSTLGAREGFLVLFCGDSERRSRTIAASPLTVATKQSRNKKAAGTQGREQGNIKQFWELREQNSVKMKTSKIEIETLKEIIS